MFCLQKRAPDFDKIWCHYFWIFTPKNCSENENHFAFSTKHFRWFHMVGRFSYWIMFSIDEFLKKANKHSVKKTISHFIAVDESLRCKIFYILNCYIETIEAKCISWMLQTHIVPYSNWLMFRCACWTWEQLIVAIRLQINMKYLLLNGWKKNHLFL